MGTSVDILNLKLTTSTLAGNEWIGATTTACSTTSTGFGVTGRTEDGKVKFKPWNVGTSIGVGLVATTTTIGINIRYGLDATYQHQETQVVSPIYDSIRSEHLETATYQYESHLQAAELKNGLYNMKDEDLEEKTETAFKDNNKHVQSPIESIKQSTQDALYQAGIGKLQIEDASNMSWAREYCKQLSPKKREEYLAAIDAKEAELQAGTPEKKPKQMVKRLQTSSKHL